VLNVPPKYIKALQKEVLDTNILACCGFEKVDGIYFRITRVKGGEVITTNSGFLSLA
jgi:hypothetical protein